MNILVINSGSSSLKYQLIDMRDEKVLSKGNCERIGEESSFIEYKTDGIEIKKEITVPNHKVAFMQVKDLLLDNEFGVIKNFSEVKAVGHRVVQGGCISHESCLVDDRIIDEIKALESLAILHTPANVIGIEYSKEVFGADIPQVVVFDTAFHITMPQKAYMYAIPYEYYEKYGVRRFGFHGTSYRFVSEEIARRMGKDIREIKLIACHIGNGSSIAAIDGGRAIDTTSGLSPLDGLMMGTRSGSLDPSVVIYLAEKENLTPAEIYTILNKKSGLLGVSGVSSDDRDILIAEAEGNKRAKLTHDMLYYQIAKYIGAYYVALGGCDCIVFTAGLGENQPILRKTVCDYLKCLGVEIDYKVNKAFVGGKEGRLSTEKSKIRVELVATNEELIIARDTKKIIENMSKKS